MTPKPSFLAKNVPIEVLDRIHFLDIKKQLIEATREFYQTSFLKLPFKQISKTIIHASGKLLPITKAVRNNIYKSGTLLNSSQPY